MRPLIRKNHSSVCGSGPGDRNVPVPGCWSQGRDPSPDQEGPDQVLHGAGASILCHEPRANLPAFMESHVLCPVSGQPLVTEGAAGLCCGRAKGVPRPVPELGEGLENKRSLNRGTQSQRDALGRDPQEKELEALNGDKFHLSRVSSKNFGDFTRLDTGRRAGCECPGRMTTCPEDTVLARPHRALGGCVWAFSIQSTHAWLGNRTLQAGECPGEAVTHCRL